MIELRELFTKALLSLPPIAEKLTLGDLQQGCRFKAEGGVYIFYNLYHEPLYVGISNNVGKRTVDHIGSSKGNKDLIKYIEAGRYICVEVFYEPDKMYQEVYESYLIHQLNPRYNIQKTGRVKL